MGRLTGLAAGLAVAAILAAPALAADAPGGIDTIPAPAASAPDRPAGKAAARQPRVFISPSGEPFRQSPSDPDPLKAWFDQVDAGHKGYIDRADLRADATRFFKKLDENGDGVIDGFEVADYEAKIAPELIEWAQGDFPGEFPQGRGQRSGGAGGGDSGPPGGPSGGHQRGGRRGGEEAQQQAPQGDGGSQQQRGRGAQRGVFQLINEPEPVSDADFNLDSHITLDEWIRAADRRFAILDANKDGRVTLEELRARFLPIKK